LKQAQDYLLGPHEAFGMLAQFPEAGRAFHEFRRHEHGGDIIFYLADGDAVTIVDVVQSGRDIEAWRPKRR
jgi:plasmid stabilization system protein ParE